MKKKHKILPLFIPFQGCRYRCVYCNQNNITGITDKEELVRSVESQLARWMSMSEEWDEVAFYGGTFTRIPFSVRQKLYSLIPELPVRLSTCPDSLADDFLNEIEEYNIKTVELGVQSLSSAVLSANGRSYKPKEAIDTLNLLYGRCETSVQLMTGMFKETRKDFLKTCDGLTSVKATFARIYPTLVMENTLLEEYYRKGRFVPDTPSETIMKAAWLYILLESAGIRVIRMGLPPEAEGIIAGFKHPAFGDIVKTVIIYAFVRLYEHLPNGNFGGYKRTIKCKFILPVMEEVTSFPQVVCMVNKKVENGLGWFAMKDVEAFATKLAEM